MLTISKIRSHPVIDFAAEELKKYLRMMMPRCGEINVAYAPKATTGFRLGLTEDFGISSEEVADPVLDDLLHIDTTEQGGVLVGSNPRSVLLAVYRYLTINGCRWLFPGIDGEYIPLCSVKPVRYHKMADCRFRGQCNEGAEFQQNMLDAIDFTPKLGMNVFMIEFDNPKAYYDGYYNHVGTTREAEPITAEIALQWKRQCECEIAKRGLQFHDMGHGWTAEPFGIRSTNGWAQEYDNPVPEDVRPYLALYKGKRDLYRGVALNTQFCMSNAEARNRVTDYITEYAKSHKNADYLHVWLADGRFNHCECENCVQLRPSDWYVILLNELDKKLTHAKLDTRVVFICYNDTAWPPLSEKLCSSKRFSFMLAPSYRSYGKSVPQELFDDSIPTYLHNCKEHAPKTAEEYLKFAKAWKQFADCPSLVYEYHFWIHQYRDPGAMKFAEMLHYDVRNYKTHGFQGIIQDGSQRSFFPNGFTFYVYAETLFDTSVSFDKLKEDYFQHAYGENWKEILSYLESVSKLFCMEYLQGEFSSDTKKSTLYNPAHAAALRQIPEHTETVVKLLKANPYSPFRTQTVAKRLLLLHAEYCKDLSQACVLKAMGADAEAKEALEQLLHKFSEKELEWQGYYDQSLVADSFSRAFDNHKL